VSGTHHLSGLRIYQTLIKDKHGKEVNGHDGHPKVERSIMTFRIASSKQAGQGIWDHPGVKPMHFLEDAYQWAVDEWDNRIAPEILRSIVL
jgi:hypothetical protein